MVGCFKLLTSHESHFQQSLLMCPIHKQPKHTPFTLKRGSFQCEPFFPIEGKTPKCVQNRQTLLTDEIMSGFLAFVVMLLFSTVVTVVAKLPFGIVLGFKLDRFIPLLSTGVAS